MNEFFTSIGNWFQTIFRQFRMMGLNDFIDIIIVSVLLYYIYKFIKDRRAGKLAGGIALLFIVLFIAEIFEFYTLSFIFQNIFQIGLLALVIIFQPELRAALEKVGRESLRGFVIIKPKASKSEIEKHVDEICAATFDLSASKTGALIVLENTTKLQDIAKTGTQINADINRLLVENIFYNKAPLHDGAMIISDMRILSAGCFLPLTDNSELSKELGTRHRAAVGMSEASDAKVIVVSEETGVVSVAHNGELCRRYTPETLKNDLMSFYNPTTLDEKIKKRKRIIRKPKK